MVARISGWTICLVLVLTVPVAGCNRGGEEAQPSAPASPAPAPAAAPSPSPSPSPSPQKQVYTVKSGDTLSEIALRFDTTVEAMMEVNDLDDPDILGIGDELIIPSPDEEPEGEAAASEASG